MTSSTRTRLESKSIKVEKIQFYVDRDIELKVSHSKGETKVVSGVVKEGQDKQVNIVLIKKNTMGVCIRSSANTLDISFQGGTDNFLRFGVAANAPSNAPYQIFANDWKPSKHGGEYGSIMYGGKKYFISGETVGAKLLIKKSVDSKVKVTKDVIKGRKL